MQNENDPMKTVRLGQTEFEGSWSKGFYAIFILLVVIAVGALYLWHGPRSEQAASAVTTNQAVPVRSRSTGVERLAEAMQTVEQPAVPARHVVVDQGASFTVAPMSSNPPKIPTEAEVLAFQHKTN